MKIFPKNLSSNFHWLRIDIRNVSRHSNTLRSRKDRLLMYTRKFTASKLFAAVSAAAMLLTMTVSALQAKFNLIMIARYQSPVASVSLHKFTLSLYKPPVIQLKPNLMLLCIRNSLSAGKKSAPHLQVQIVPDASKYRAPQSKQVRPMKSRFLLKYITTAHGMTQMLQSPQKPDESKVMLNYYR